MIYLVCPEGSKWFLAEAESYEELIEKSSLLEKIRSVGKGAAIIRVSEGNDEETVVLYTKGDMNKKERDEFLDCVSSGNYYDRAMTANQISALLVLLTDDEDEEEEDI